MPEEIEQGAIDRLQKFKINIVEKKPDWTKFVPIDKTLQNVCAKEKQFHEVGKRAFQAYFKFLVFCKNNKSQRLCLQPELVRKLKLEEYAHSFGLLKCPELTHFKRKSKKKDVEKEGAADGGKFGGESDSGEDDDICRV